MISDSPIKIIMKMALLTPTYSPFSGIDRVVELDAKEYSKQGNRVTIFTFRAELKSEYANIVQWNMPSNQTLERIYRLLFFFDIFKIKKCVRELEGFDTVIAYFYPMTCIASKARKKYKIKYIYWNAGIAHPELFKKLAERIYLKLLIYFVKLTVKRADSAISISQFLKNELLRESNLDSVVKYIEVDRKRFNKNIEKGNIRRKYDIEKDDPILLFVGRISPHKGIDLLVKSFNIVLRNRPNAKLIIVGKETFDDYAKELRTLSSGVSAKSIIFSGFVEDESLPYYYIDCDIYTTATLWEGFDLPCVEAQYCGKSVVAFDLASHSEVVKNGILVEAKNINEFSKAILKTISGIPQP